MKNTIVNIAALTVAALVGLATMWVSASQLREPDGLLDWVVLVLSGMTTGILAFFLIWGHFQKDPAAEAAGPGHS